MPLWVRGLLVGLCVIYIEFAAILDYKLYKEERIGLLFWNSMLMALAGWVITTFYVDVRIMVIPDCLGAGIGAVLAARIFPYKKTGKDE